MIIGPVKRGRSPQLSADHSGVESDSGGAQSQKWVG